MGHQIIQQPDGHYAIYSPTTGRITLRDATEPDIINWHAHHAAQEARTTATRHLNFIKTGHPHRAYHQFTITWDEALEADRNHRDTTTSENAPHD